MIEVGYAFAIGFVIVAAILGSAEYLKGKVPGAEYLRSRRNARTWAAAITIGLLGIFVGQLIPGFRSGFVIVLCLVVAFALTTDFRF